MGEQRKHSLIIILRQAGLDDVSVLLNPLSPMGSTEADTFAKVIKKGFGRGPNRSPWPPPPCRWYSEGLACSIGEYHEEGAHRLAGNDWKGARSERRERIAKVEEELPDLRKGSDRLAPISDRKSLVHLSLL